MTEQYLLSVFSILLTPGFNYITNKISKRLFHANWQPVQVTYKVSVLIAKVCGKRQVSEGAIVAAAAVGGSLCLCYLS